MSYPYHIFHASNCVDGNLNNFCHTPVDSPGVTFNPSQKLNPSLTLDLGTAVQIAYVAVYNRRDCCQNRLEDYTVSYRVRSTDAWTVCAEATAAADSPLQISECPQLAQYVMIQLPGAERTLNLAEVEVYSHRPVYSHHYTLMGDALSWADANAACLAAGLQLASVQSAAENALLATVAGTNYVWIGGTDAASEGAWVWSPSNKPLSYTNWNEPNNEPNGGGGENCMAVYPSGPFVHTPLAAGKWNDAVCTDKNKYVCSN